MHKQTLTQTWEEFLVEWQRKFCECGYMRLCVREGKLEFFIVCVAVGFVVYVCLFIATLSAGQNKNGSQHCAQCKLKLMQESSVYW